MITCPNCQKGLLWGVYIDIPPEMKAGQAEWLACEPPEPQSMVTCPSCQQEAGTYEDLYDADADSRRAEKRAEKQAIRESISIQSWPEFFLLGLRIEGNPSRDALRRETWTTFSTWLSQLRKSMRFPKQGQVSENGALIPAAVGARFAESGYMAAIPLPVEWRGRIEMRLSDPEYNDPKGLEILTVEGGPFAVLSVRNPDQIARLEKFLVQTVTDDASAVKRREGPTLEWFGDWPDIEDNEEDWPPFDLGLPVSAGIAKQAEPEAQGDPLSS